MPENKTSSFYSEASTTVADDEQDQEEDEKEDETALNLPQRKQSGASVDWYWKVRQVERIAFSSTAETRHCFTGTLCLFCYISLWLLGSLAVPAAIVLFLLKLYIAGGLLTAAIILCYAVPVRVSQRFRQLCRTHFGGYFQEASVRLEHVPDPDVDRPTVFCLNPHGVFSMSWAMCYLMDELQHAHYCFSTMLRLNPFLRLLTQLLGNPSDAKKDTIIDHLRNGRSIALIPGAWHEASIHTPSADRVYIQKRQGFVKYALEYNCTVTPSYCFGEKETYSNVQGCFPFRFWLNDRKILGVLPWGSSCCFLLPRPVKLHTVIGAPIELPHIPNPTFADVNKWHQVYIQELVDLYDRYKGYFYGPEGENRHLEIW